MAVHVYDIEVYPNLFTAVFLNTETNEYKDFVIRKGQNDGDTLRAFLEENHWLVGFNNKSYDDKVLSAVIAGKNNKQIYELSKSIIDGDKVYPKYKPNSLDLLLVNNYNNQNRYTSLKWVSFAMREKNLADLPVSPDKEVPDGKVKDIIKYNRIDTEHTNNFYKLNSKHLKLRNDLAKMYNNTAFLNFSETNIGREVFLLELSKKTGVPVKEIEKGRTFYNRIALQDCISDKVKFTSEGFQGALEYFKTKVITEQDKESGGIILKGSCDYKVVHEDIEYQYGVGGLHGANTPGVYDVDDEHFIYDADFSSFYPITSITQEIYPKHLGKLFLETYKDIYDKRQTFAKGTTENYVYKIVLNAAFGQMMSVYSPFYDPMAFLKITINGQLFLSMLIEAYSKYGTIIQANTDGVTGIFRNEHKAKLEEINKRFEKYTGMILETQQYSKFILKDVNNYIAVGLDGKAKRKGLFEIYKDYTENHSYHKNPSALVIPSALSEYFLNGKDVEQHILEETNMHEFCYGIKKQSNFDYMLWTADENRVVSNDKLPYRVVRYYVSKSGGCIFKHFNDGRITGVNVGQLVKPLMNMRWEHTERYTDIDREWYINETKKIINEICGE